VKAESACRYCGNSSVENWVRSGFRLAASLAAFFWSPAEASAWLLICLEKIDA